MTEAEADVSYELEEEGAVDGVAATGTEEEVPQDNGDATAGEAESKKKLPDSADAEADEHDYVAMPSMKVVMNDMSGLSTRKCFLVHTLTVDDLNNPTIAGLLRSSMCNDIKLQFCRSGDDESQLLGLMNVSAVTSKQANVAMAEIQQNRPDLVVETLKPSESLGAFVQKWKTDHSIANKSLTGEMLIVKNLDATVTVDQLSEIFPDAEEITLGSQPQASYLGKLKGTKHAYVVFPDEQTADAMVVHADANPIELNGRQLIIRHYMEPPSHVPKGYMRLTTRKLVLRQIAHARGLMARAQEDPTYELAAVWHTRLETANELIEKDDKARSILGLMKPTLLDYKEINLKETLMKSEIEKLLSTLGIGPESSSVSAANRSGVKRLFPQSGSDSDTANKVTRGRGGVMSIAQIDDRPPALMSSQISRGRPPRGGRFSRGMGFDVRGRARAMALAAVRYSDDLQRAFDALTPGPQSFRMSSPRMLAMRAARGRMPHPDYDFMGW